MGQLSGLTIVVTGTLSNMTRDQTAALLKKSGAKITDTVNRNVDYVVVGDNPGSKLTKAKELGIKLLNESQLGRLLAFGPEGL